MPKVLGVSSRAGGEHLTAYFVQVTGGNGDVVEVRQLQTWKGTRGQDPGSQLLDLKDAVSNLLDKGLPNSPDLAAIKRVEQPFKGKPPATYDDRIRFEAAVMMGALAQGRRCFSYRTIELARGGEFAKKALEIDGSPSSAEAVEALKAACAALSDLGEVPD